MTVLRLLKSTMFRHLARWNILRRFSISTTAQRLIDTLKVFDVNAELAYYVAGPVVTQYALTLDLGTRVEKVAGLSRNLQMALQATSLRIEAPIPGKNAVGIEVPNLKPASVHFREIIDGDLWRKNSPSKFQVPLLLGKDAAGTPAPRARASPCASTRSSTAS